MVIPPLNTDKRQKASKKKGKAAAETFFTVKPYFNHSQNQPEPTKAEFRIQGTYYKILHSYVVEPLLLLSMSIFVINVFMYNINALEYPLVRPKTSCFRHTHAEF